MTSTLGQGTWTENDDSVLMQNTNLSAAKILKRTITACAKRRSRILRKEVVQREGSTPKMKVDAFLSKPENKNLLSAEFVDNAYVKFIKDNDANAKVEYLLFKTYFDAFVRLTEGTEETTLVLGKKVNHYPKQNPATGYHTKKDLGIKSDRITGWTLEMDTFILNTPSNLVVAYVLGKAPGTIGKRRGILIKAGNDSVKQIKLGRIKAKEAARAILKQIKKEKQKEEVVVEIPITNSPTNYPTIEKLKKVREVRGEAKIQTEAQYPQVIISINGTELYFDKNNLPKKITIEGKISFE